jgi:hypothetical protein
MTTQDLQKLSDDIDRKKTLKHKTLQRIKAAVSAVFTYAMQQSLVSRNPVQGTPVEGNRRDPDRYAYSLKELLAMVSVLPRRSATVVALAGLTGLREKERFAACSGRIMTGNTSTSLEAYGVPMYIIRNQMPAWTKCQ